MAGVLPDDDDLPSIKKEVLTNPLRYTTNVFQHLKPTLENFEIWESAPPSDSSFLGQGPGPDAIKLRHQDGVESHSGTWPLDCHQCGILLAEQLEKLGVSAEGILIFLLVNF